MISEEELLAQVPHQLFIGGEWVDAAAGETLDVHDPATNKVIATIASARAGDAVRALDREHRPVGIAQAEHPGVRPGARWGTP